MFLGKSNILLYSCISFIFGIGIASFLPKEFVINDLYYFAGAILLFVLTIHFWNNTNEHTIRYTNPTRLVFLFGLFVLLGAWRYSLSIESTTENDIWYYNNSKISFVGQVADEPIEKNNFQRLEVKVLNMAEPSSASWQNRVPPVVNGKVLITTERYPRFEYGDYLEINCELKAPEKFNGFQYDRYLARYDVYSVCYFPKRIVIFDLPIGGNESLDISTQRDSSLSLPPTRFAESRRGLGEAGRMTVKKSIIKFKNKIRGIIDRGLIYPEASIVKAMVLGDKQAIDDETRKSFSRTGLSHIVAISGMHIGFIVLGLMWFLIEIGFWRKHAFYGTTLLLFLYIIAIGAPASAIRAGVMGFMVMLAFYLGRLSRVVNSLILAAALMLIVNPKILRDDVGFQLSFLAVLGILILFPIITQKINFKPKNFFTKYIYNVFIISISVQVFITPIIALNFDQVSLISPIVNLFVIWTLPFVLAFSFLAIALSALIPQLGLIFFLPVMILVSYIAKIAEIFSNLLF